MKTLVALFDRFEDANAAIEELMHRGLEPKDISVLARDAAVQDRIARSDNPFGRTMADGAVGGAALGGLSGLLVGVGLLTIPGIGAVFAAGTLAAALSSTAAGAGLGAIGGGLLGALAAWNIPDEEAQLLAEGVKRGGILVAVQTHESGAAQVARVLQEANALDNNLLRARLHRTGDSRFDESREPDEHYPRLRNP